MGVKNVPAKGRKLNLHFGNFFPILGFKPRVGKRQAHNHLNISSRGGKKGGLLPFIYIKRGLSSFMQKSIPQTGIDGARQHDYFLGGKESLLGGSLFQRGTKNPYVAPSKGGNSSLYDSIRGAKRGSRW